jgi:hypothetical protein
MLIRSGVTKVARSAVPSPVRSAVPGCPQHGICCWFAVIRPWNGVLGRPMAPSGRPSDRGRPSKSIPPAARLRAPRPTEPPDDEPVGGALHGSRGGAGDERGSFLCRSRGRPRHAYGEPGFDTGSDGPRLLGGTGQDGKAHGQVRPAECVEVLEALAHGGPVARRREGRSGGRWPLPQGWRGHRGGDDTALSRASTPARSAARANDRSSSRRLIGWWLVTRTTTGERSQSGHQRSAETLTRR